jgi:plasmid stabilization system protein ParE
MAWYESQLPGLGDLFLSRVEERMRVLAETPHVYPQVLESIRRAPLRRFPYGIYYRERPGRITVLAVFHFKQAPDRLRERG